MSYKFEEVLKKGTQKIRENINEYKNFLKVMGNNYKYDGLNQINIYVLEPNARACAEFGADPSGNIFRMDNLIEKIPEIKKDFENKLTVYQEELNNAKEEVVKPFQQEEILKEKKERLSELNKLLDMGNNDKMKENSWNKEKECITR